MQAQIAANERGSQQLLQMVDRYRLETVQAYMQHIQDNAEEAVRQAITVLQDGNFTYEMDDGNQIQVSVKIKDRSAIVDFTGTSPQQSSNLNAPLAICKAVVLYVFRTLVQDDIPLNAGCLKPLEIIVPEGCLLNPRYPAAVVAGNVETSQAIANALYGALGVLAASQGTMNNFTFGNEQYQYYETICGGSGAGATFDGTDAVQTHMTNSRLTDPEVLEWRFPVLVDTFAIRAVKWRSREAFRRKWCDSSDSVSRGDDGCNLVRASAHSAVWISRRSSRKDGTELDRTIEWNDRRSVGKSGSSDVAGRCVCN